ncbi:MAG TPA: SMC-Scp complex subunit ScpB [Candidatus Thermoplasmatota archaeon]|nr:SMC-Scp complex subunit ScpB [Candidatus Thermoplasmatota archaeon]
MAAERAPPDAALDPVLVVEAALFSAGKPLSTDEIAENAGLDKRKVLPALKALAERYAASQTALEIGRAGEKWSMQVRTRYAERTTRLAPMEIPIKLLKTLALIAYHQPVLQSDLKEMVGDKVYDHVKELGDLGLVKKRVHERSFLILTSERFPEYFGIPASDREGIKTFLAEKVGLELPKTDAKGNAKLTTFPPREGTETEEENSQNRLRASP